MVVIKAFKGSGFKLALASPPACKPMKSMGWKRTRSQRLGECDVMWL